MKPECKDDLQPERDILKFLQGRAWKINEAATSLISNLEFLRQASGLEVTPQIMKVLHSGCMYLFGRDREYRITIVVDLTKMVQILAVDPEMVSTENMSIAF